MKFTHMYRVWCEWDVGQDNVIFTSKSAAQEWIKNNLHLLEIVSDEAYAPSHDPLELMACGDVGYHAVSVVSDE